MPNPGYSSHHVRNELYISHFLSTWNSRLFEFGAVLFISTIFPGTLFPASIYALTRSASVVVFSTAIGHLIDRCERIFLIRLSISKLFSLVNIIFYLPFDPLCCFHLCQACLACSSFLSRSRSIPLTNFSRTEGSHSSIMHFAMALTLFWTFFSRPVVCKVCISSSIPSCLRREALIRRQHHIR